jgi:3-O-methylgallate 3,4-dioxygenase
MLSTPPEQWGQRVIADRANPKHFYKGGTYTFEQLAKLREKEQLGNQVSQEIWASRHAACRRALAELAAVFDRVKPDVVVIIGNDQTEIFTAANVPAFAVYWGDTILNHEYSQEFLAKKAPGIAVSVPGHIPPNGAVYPGQPELGRHLIESVTRDNFDVASLAQFPAVCQTIPHAYGFVYRQIMSDRAVPSVPVFINTFYPPNQPTVQRCYEFGKSIVRAIQSWDSDARVALIASGGLSHFVIDEEVDRIVLDALRSADITELAQLPEPIFQSGTSEIKNWVPVAGAMAELGLPMTLVDYVPCYRSEAGTGNGMGFVYWEGKNRE